MSSAHWRFAAVILGAALLGGGCGSPSLLITPVSNSSELNEEVVQPGQGWFAPKVAIIEVEGTLANAKSGGFLAPTENAMSLFQQQLDRAAADGRVKALVLRINSPGGTVTASDGMYEILRRFRKDTGKPVVASIQEVGASGAYYLSCGADEIYAQPTSIVGSIGVIFESLEFSGTLSKIGAVSWAITSGPLKEMGSPFKPLEPRERAVMKEMVDEYFARFVGVVKSRRPHLLETAKPNLTDYRDLDYAGIFSGRVFSGAEAQRRGLIDQTGLLADAIDRAKVLGSAPDASTIMYRRPYEYSGSIYASTAVGTGRATSTVLEVPGAQALVPAGFYYLWRPGM